MAWGRKNKKEATDAVASSPETDASAEVAADSGKRRRRRPNEMLSSVVKESAPGAAVDVLKQNLSFALPRDVGWVILLLDTTNEKFGGLSAKLKNDEAKGSIIELITADEIQVVATTEMLDKDMLGIVPTESTLDRMRDYALLRNADYFWGVMRQKPDGTLTVDGVDTATYPKAVEMHKEDGPLLRDVLPDVWAWAETVEDSAAEPPTETGSINSAEVAAAVEATADAPAPDTEVSAPADTEVEAAPEAPVAGDEVSDLPFAEEEAPAPAPAMVDPDDEGAVNYEDLADEAGVDEDFDPLSEASFHPDDVEADAYAGYDGPEDLDDHDESDEDHEEVEPDAYEQYVTENYDRDVSGDEVRSTIARRFLSEDLNLEVDTEEFERMFRTDAPAITIEVGDQTNWLSEQVAEMARQANSQLEQLHEDHTDELHQAFVEIMSLHAQTVIQRVSLVRDDSYFSKLMAEAKADLANSQARSSEEISARRAEITERFSREADAAAEAAMHQARALHNQRNISTRERLLAEVSVDVERRNEERFVHAQKTVQAMRREDANNEMELGVSEAFKILAERHEQQRTAQAALLHSWNDNIMAFIDENRKNDVARAEALAEQLARQNSVAELTEQFAREREALQAEQRDRVARLEEHSEQIRRDAVVELEARDEQWRHKMGVKEAELSESSRLVQTLTEQMGGLKTTYAEHAQEQIDVANARAAQAVAEIDGYKDQMDRMNRLQSRSSKILVVMIVALVLGGLLVGAIIGWTLSLPTQNAADAMILLPTGVTDAVAGALGT